MMQHFGANAVCRALPREIAPGIFWLGKCLEIPYQGRPLHTYNATFLVVGENACALIDGGPPTDLPDLEIQLEGLLSQGIPELRFLISTHTEVPHSGGFARLLKRFPNTQLCGDVTDYHLAFPEFADRLLPMVPGDRIDLGNTELRIVEAVFRDLASTVWVFDTARRVLFASDGMSYMHYHEKNQCGCLAEEAEQLDFADMTSIFSEIAFAWTQFVNMKPFVDRLDRMIFDELDVAIIAPAHGLPITNPRETMKKIRAGLLESAKA